MELRGPSWVSHICFCSFWSIVGATALNPSICKSSGMFPAMIKPSEKITLQEVTPGRAQASAIAALASNFGAPSAGLAVSNFAAGPVATRKASTGAESSTFAASILGAATLGI